MAGGYVENITYLSNIINSVEELITYGKSIEEINTMLNKKYDQINSEKLKEVIKDTVEDNSNYRFIQKIMRSKIVVNIQTDEHILFDKLKRHTEPISDKVIRTTMHPKFNTNSLKVACKFDYRPFKDEVLWEDRSTDMHIYNTYVPPKWYARKFYSKGEKKVLFPDDGMPKMYKKFFDHITGGSGS